MLSNPGLRCYPTCPIPSSWIPHIYRWFYWIIAIPSVSHCNWPLIICRVAVPCRLAQETWRATGESLDETYWDDPPSSTSCNHIGIILESCNSMSFSEKKAIRLIEWSYISQHIYIYCIYIYIYVLYVYIYIYIYISFQATVAKVN